MVKAITGEVRTKMRITTEEEDRGKEVFMMECIIKVTKDTTKTSSMIITTKISTMGTEDNTMVIKEAPEETMKMGLARSRVREGQIRGKGDTTNLGGEATTRRAWQTHLASQYGKRDLNA